MSDPLSVTAGIIAVVTATIQSSTVLYHTIESFKNYPQRVRELLQQLESLIKVLSSLHELSEQDESVGAPLEIPLRECGATCRQFREVLERHRGSLSNGKSFSAWLSLRFRNGDIVNFMETLAVYKSTMAIAIADANLRTSQVTLRVLNEYKKEVDATTGHLHQYFEEVLARLDELRAPNFSSQQNTARTSEYVEQMREETRSIEYCVQICRRFQADFDQAQFQLAQGLQLARRGSSPANPSSTQDMTLAHMTTLSCLKACALETAHTVNKLSRQKTTARSRLLDDPQGHRNLQEEEHTRVGDQGLANDPAAETEGIEHELDSVKHLLHFCEDASSRATPDRVHIIEDITVGDNSQQVCISTVGDLFKIRKAKAGNNSFQFFGSIGSEHLHDITMIHVRGQNRHEPGDEKSSGEQEGLFEHVHASSSRRAS